MQEPLSVLFGGQARVRLLRLFLLNPNAMFTIESVMRRTTRTELSVLERAKLIKKKAVLEETDKGRRRVAGYMLNPVSELVLPLRQFCLETSNLTSTTLQRHLRGIGKLDVLVGAGVFKKEFDRRLDVLIATPKPNMQKISESRSNTQHFQPKSFSIVSACTTSWCGTFLITPTISSSTALSSLVLCTGRVAGCFRMLR